MGKLKHAAVSEGVLFFDKEEFLENAKIFLCGSLSAYGEAS